MQQSLEKKKKNAIPKIFLLVGLLRNQLANRDRMLTRGFQGRCYFVFIIEVALRVGITNTLPLGGFGRLSRAGV